MTAKQFLKCWYAKIMRQEEVQSLDKEQADTTAARWWFALVTGIINCVGYICVPVVISLFMGLWEYSPSTWVAFVAVGIIVGFLSFALMLPGKSTLSKIMLPGATSLAVGVVSMLLCLPHQRWAMGVILFVPLILIGVMSAWIRFSPIVEASSLSYFNGSSYDVKRDWIKETASFWRTVTISLTFGFLVNIIPLVYWARGIAGRPASGNGIDDKSAIFCLFYSIIYTGYMIVGPIRLSFQKAWEATDKLLHIKCSSSEPSQVQTGKQNCV